MRYIYPDRFAPHWCMISHMVDERYWDQDPSALVIFKLYLKEDMRHYRDRYTGDKLIIYQLEPLRSVQNIDFIIQQLRYADEVWEYDYENWLILKQHGIHALFRPFIHSENISIKEKNHKDIDVLFYGGFTAHRMEALSKLCEDLSPRYNIHCLGTVMTPLLDHYVSRSKIIVNIHHSASQTQQEQTKLGYLLATGKMVISEKSAINYYGDLILETTLGYDLSHQTKKCLENFQDYDEVFRKRMFNALMPDDLWDRGLAWHKTQQSIL